MLMSRNRKAPMHGYGNWVESVQSTAGHPMHEFPAGIVKQRAYHFESSVSLEED